jgi:mevalonate kinase
LFGDIAYLNYHGKVWHAPLRQEPFVTYEKLGPYVPDLRFCVATTGIRRDSGSVHGPMRERYLRERRAGVGPLLELARRLGETAWKGKIALLEGDLRGFGTHIDRNQDLIDDMMRLCGFGTGAGREVTGLVQAARRGGALGAKLTGAGGGGAVFALALPGGEDRLCAALKDAARAQGLTDARVLVLPVTPIGLKLQP